MEQPVGLNNVQPQVQEEEPLTPPTTAERVSGMAGGIDITELSGKEESGSGGVHTISEGTGDPGGVSYGAHQLMSKRNKGEDSTMDKFLQSDYAVDFRDEFAGLTPGTKEFSDVYERVTNESPDQMENAQKQFILKTHYEPIREWATSQGFDTEDPGVASALYSISVQHGKWKKFLRGVDTSKNNDEVISDIYDRRLKYVKGNSELSDDWKANIGKRYARESEAAKQLSVNRQPEPEQPAGPLSVPDGEPLGPQEASLSDVQQAPRWQDIPEQIDRL